MAETLKKTENRKMTTQAVEKTKIRRPRKRKINLYTWRERSLIAGVSVIAFGGFVFCFVMILLMTSIHY